MSEAVKENDMEAYSKITDEVFNRILDDRSDGLKDSRVLLERIQKRKLYKLAHMTIIKHKEKCKQVSKDILKI